MSTTNPNDIIIPGTVNNVDIRLRKSGATGDLKGGAIHSSEIVFGVVQNLSKNQTQAQAELGNRRHYCVYLYNANPDYSIRNAIFYFAFDTTSPDDFIEMGLDPTAGVNQTAQTIADEFTEPTGVDFKFADSRDDPNALVIEADIPPLGYIPIWIRITMTSGANSFERSTGRLAIDYGRTDQFLPVVYSVCLVGNMGCSNEAFPAILTRMRARSPDLILFLGGMSDTGNATCWLNAIRDVKGISKITFGRMDGFDPGNETLENQYKNAFSLDTTMYSFDFHNVHFLVLNTIRKTDQGSFQYQFADQDLKRAFENSRINWIIVVGYQSMWSAKLASGEKSAARTTRENLAPLLERYGAHLYINARQHNYQRLSMIKMDTTLGDTTHPLRDFTEQAPDYFFPPDKRGFLGLDGRYATLHVMCGTGGMPLDVFDDNENVQYEWVEQKNDEFFGYLFLEFRTQGQEMSGRFYDHSDRSRDTFSLRTKEDLGA